MLHIVSLLALFSLMFAIFGLCRYTMLKSFTQCSFKKEYLFYYPLRGALQELALLLILFAISTNISFWLEPYGGKIAGVLLFIVGGCFFLFLNILDTAIFREAQTRFNRTVFQNTNVYSIKAMLHAREYGLFVLVVLLLTLVGAAFYWALEAFTVEDAWLPALGLVGALAVLYASSGFSTEEDSYSLVFEEKNGWIRNEINGYIARDVELVVSPAIVALLKTFMVPNRVRKIAAQPYNDEEKGLLKAMGLLEPSIQVVPFTPKKYSRVIVVCMESLSQFFVPLFNPKIPQEVMPFLSYLIKRYHNLGMFYTSAMPTEYGLSALLASRLMDAWNKVDTRQETLFSVLKQEGYETFFLRAASKYYNNHYKSLPPFFKVDNFIEGSTLNDEFPEAIKNDWGISDHYLYQKAVRTLNQNKNKPTCLVMLTADTHAPGWSSMHDFPEAVQKTRSRWLKSMHQADCELAIFFNNLKKLQLFDDDTLLVITADHSPNFGPEFLKWSGLSSFYPNVVPCVFVTTKPGPFTSIPQTTLGCQLDFLPTFCQGMGLHVPDTVLGRSMFYPEKRFVLQQSCSEITNVASPEFQHSIDSRKAPMDGRSKVVQKWLAKKLVAAQAD